MKHEMQAFEALFGLIKSNERYSLVGILFLFSLIVGVRLFLPLSLSLFTYINFNFDSLFNKIYDK